MKRKFTILAGALVLLFAAGTAQAHTGVSGPHGGYSYGHSHHHHDYSCGHYLVYSRVYKEPEFIW